MRITLWSAQSRRGKEHAESGNISSFQLACPRNHSTLGLVPDILYCIWYSVFRIRLDVTDKVGTTPNAGIAAGYRSGHRRITNHGNSTSFLANNLLLSTVTVQVNQATLSLQIELISHMHIWGTERLRPWIEVSYLSHHHSLRHQGCFRAGTTSIEAYLLSMGHGSCALYDYTWNIRNTYTKYFIQST